MKTKELFKQMQNKIILDIKNNEVACPDCKGIRVVYKERNEKGYVENCNRCYNGKLYKCEFCGRLNKTNFCRCKDAENKRHIDFQEKEYIKEQEYYKKAKKIKIKDYDGMLISLYNEERVVDIDEFLEQVRDMKYDNPDFDMKWTFGTKKHKHLNINIWDIIYNATEDSYEGMYDYLDMDSNKLDKIQELIDKWLEEQGDGIYIYNEDRSVVVLLDE